MASAPAHGGRAYRLTVAGLAIVLTLIVFLNSWGVFTADIKPEVYLAPRAMLGDYLSAWTFSPYLGGPNFNTGLAPIVAVLAGLREVGMSPEIAFKVFHLVLWVSAAWGMVRLVRRLEPQMSPLISLVAGIAYVANPYAVSAGSTLPILLPLAILPWQILVLLRAFEQPRRWRWPALFGLTFFLMSGANAGVVPVFGLLAVIPVAVYSRHQFALRWRAVVAVVAKCAAFVVLLSLYWLIPSLFAATTGTSIVANSESLESIADVSSFSEVLRGLGLWPLYGRGSAGPWIPGQVMYITSTVVVLATFLASALAVHALGSAPRRVARLLTGLIVMATVVMVGMYPAGSPSVFGQSLSWLFDSIPALSAFRTTNKIGAVLFVGLALAVAYAMHEFFRRHGPSSRPAMAVLAGSVVLAVLVSLPAWTGKLYTSEVDIPDYWTQAAKTVDNAPAERRVLALPGQVQASYRWSQPRPDDVFNSLISRDVFIPITTPSTSKTAFNFGAALDDSFQSGLAGPNVTSTFARYLGADSLLLRHDVNWEDYGGARPSQTQATVNADSGLTPVRNFGRPGENVGSLTVLPDGFAETNVPPLQLYGINNPGSIVRAEPQQGSLVVAGDGWSVNAMSRTPLLQNGPAFRYAPDLSAEAWKQSLRSGNRMVLTDTNRRRDSISNRLTNGQGPLLAAEDDLPGTTRTLGDDSQDQTVLEVAGGSVKASQSGFAFFDAPWAAPDNAFDNDPETSWIFGDFENGKGATLDLTFDAPRPVSEVKIKQTERGTVRIKSLTVEAGGEKEKAEFDVDGIATIDLGASGASRVRFTIDELIGDGFNAVGIQDITIEGVGLTRIARTPTTFDNRFDAMDPATQDEFSQTPLDVLLTRAQGTLAAGDEEESNLQRDFSVPDERSFDAQAVVRVDNAREDAYDALAGIPRGATSNERYFDNPDLRASQAFDVKDSTAWIPDNPVAGSWIQLDGPERDLPELTFDQRKVPEAEQTNWATRITVIADGKELASEDVEPGDNTIDLTVGGEAPTVRNVRIEIDESADASGTATPPRIREIDAGRTLEADEDADGCLRVAALDGESVFMRPQDRASAQGSAWELCGDDIELAAGPHTLRTTDPTITVDSLDLLDVQEPEQVTPASAPEVVTERGFGASMRVRTAANPGGAPYFLTIGQGYDPRWRAEVDGRDLGEPLVVDGYATGWLIRSAAPQDIDITFGPQRSTDLAIVASLTGLALVALILLVSFARTRVFWLEKLLTSLAARRRRATGKVPRLPNVLAPATLRMKVPSRLRAGRPRLVATWLGLAVGCFLFASWPGVVAVAILAGWHAYRRPSSSLLLAVGAGMILLAGILFILGMGENRGTVAAALVTDNSWPNLATVCGLVFALVGVWRTGPAGADSERHSTRG